MKKNASKSEPLMAVNQVEIARSRVAILDCEYKQAKELSRQSRLKRKEAKLAARQAKKLAKQAKEALVTAQKCLVDAEKKFARLDGHKAAISSPPVAALAIASPNGVRPQSRTQADKKATVKQGRKATKKARSRLAPRSN